MVVGVKAGAYIYKVSCILHRGLLAHLVYDLLFWVGHCVGLGWWMGSCGFEEF